MSHMGANRQQFNVEQEVLRQAKAERLDRESVGLDKVREAAARSGHAELLDEIHRGLSPHFRSALPFRGALAFFNDLASPPLLVVEPDYPARALAFRLNATGLARMCPPLTVDQVVRSFPRALEQTQTLMWVSWSSWADVEGLAGLLRESKWTRRTRPPRRPSKRMRPTQWVDRIGEATRHRAGSVPDSQMLRSGIDGHNDCNGTQPPRINRGRTFSA